VPESWSSLWEGPEALGAAVWMRAAVNRLEALQQWAARARDGSLLGQALRLDELLHAAFFLTALRQQTARQARLPMDQLRLSCALAPNQLPQCPLAFALDGLLLQGAVCAPPAGLAPNAPDAPTYSPMPLLHCAWVPKDARDPYPPDRSASVALYLDKERETCLAELRLPCSATEHTWLQAGCALFLDDNTD
jgi:hypothetical protein